MFAVIYQWRVKPGAEAAFVHAWHKGTLSIAEVYGSLGARLHKGADRTYYAYAAWPSRAAWEAAHDNKMRHNEPEASKTFHDAVEWSPDQQPILEMDVVDDLIFLDGGLDKNR